jgi:hypothetical protein
MENEIIRCRGELREIKAMRDDAEISKQSAQEDLHKHEEIVYSERKQREIELQRMKKEAEEKKLHQERIEKRIVSSLFSAPNGLLMPWRPRGRALFA